jgi:glycosyltransferase involved in cell wall biosynthesis
VEFVGEIGDQEKIGFLGEALALLFPIDWPEPFGLVMIEAMACGTPVIAYRRGSVAEIVVDGLTGFIVDSFDELLVAAHRVEAIDRAECRRHVEAHFSVERMADRYEAIYRRLLARWPLEYGKPPRSTRPRTTRQPVGPGLRPQAPAPTITKVAG